MIDHTIAEAAALLEIESGKLREWISRGYVRPAYPAKRRGEANFLSEENLYQVALFDHLLQLGLSRKKAAKIIKAQEDQRNQGKEIIITTLSDSSVFFDVNLKKSKIVISTSPDFDDLIVINFQKIIDKVDSIFHKG
jgi:DNA-binding transcriptional MerR regulator